MGNYLNSFNEQRKIRFKLSQAALSTLRSDIIMAQLSRQKSKIFIMN